MSLIVLEGVDGSGKTTLANILSRVLNAEVIHATRETPNDWGWFSEIMDRAKTKSIIMDRAFWGQFAYQGPMERHLTWESLHELEHRLEQEGGKLIYVTADPTDIERRLAGRNEALSLPLYQLISSYSILKSFADCTVITYNTSTGEVS